MIQMFAPAKASVSQLLWLARRCAEDGGEPWWHDDYGLTPRVLALMDTAHETAKDLAEKDMELALQASALRRQGGAK